MNELKRIENHQSGRLPWWRVGPCIVALAMLLVFAMQGTQTAGDSSQNDVLAVTSVAYQSDSDPSIQLPDVSTLSGVSAAQGQQMEKKLATANQVINAITPVDWLGPLAPVAMSPFFGITCLSGLAMWNPDWLPDNGLLDSATPLQNPMLFWVFAVLTIVTSLPRLSKLSKPMAQAVDKVEAYAGIITLLVIKYVAAPGETTADSEVMEAGIVSSSIDGILYVMLVINVLVINSVKFFFEFMIWLTPVPFIDACFEVANKAACGALMAVYAFSPTLATVINLALFAICLLALRWIGRRITLYRTLALDPLISLFSSGYATPKSASLVVFPETDWNGFQDKSRLVISRNESGLVVRQDRWLLAPVIKELPNDTTLEIQEGLLWNHLVVAGDTSVRMTFSRRYQGNVAELASKLDANVASSETLATA